MMVIMGLTSGALGGEPGVPSQRKPNILFILTDDQGWPTLGCYGGRLVPTPNLDRLATEGVRFTDAYVMPQCTPTRAALLTGQHSARNGMWHVIPWYGTPHGRLREPAFRENLSRDTFTLAKGLRAAGYATGTAGKWHLTNNADGNYGGLKPEAAPHYGFESAAPPGPGSPGEGDKHVDYLTDRAIEFAERHRERPWFFYLAHHTIHGKVSAPAPLVAKYRARGAPEDGLHNATYLAAIEHLDTSVGRLMAALDRLGLREQTMVVFLSDNGGIDMAYSARPFAATQGATAPTPTRLEVERREFSNAPLRMGKGSHYEGGIRVPCLVRWPGVTPPGGVSDVPVHVIDWLPTLLAAAGTGTPADHPVDGIDLTPVLRGNRGPERALFWYLPFYEVRWGATPAAVVREGDWKLIEFFGDSFDPEGRYVAGGRSELYRLRDDPGEKRDLAAREPARVAALREKLHGWLQSIPATIPGPNPDFDESRQLLEVRTKPPGWK
jgi:arylsulfatase A